MLDGTNFVVSSCTHTDQNESLTIAAYGCCAIVANRTGNNVEITFIENRSSNSVTFSSGAGDHVSLVYSRLSTIDLSLVGLSVFDSDGSNFILDDETTGNDTKGSTVFIPNSWAALDVLYAKYSD